MTTEREAFEASYLTSHTRSKLDKGADGSYVHHSTDAAWQAWQAACAWQREQLDPADAMTEVADRFAHRMALVLECVLMGNSSDRWWNEGHELIGEYRSAMNAIHERESPTFMGEPVIRNFADKIRSAA